MSKKAKKNLMTFQVHETNEDKASMIKEWILHYKHLDNMLCLLIRQEYEIQWAIENKSLRDYTMVNLLLNAVIMKAVISSNTGGKKTSREIATVNAYFKDNPVFQQMKEHGQILNDKCSSMIVRRLRKDWMNYFKALKDFKVSPEKYFGLPQPPKPKRLCDTYNYSVPMEPDKFAMKVGSFRITLGKRGFECFLGDCEYIADKKINGLTVSLYHGHIYYNFNYYAPAEELGLSHSLPRVSKEAGLDVGVINLFSLFVNDFTTQSLIYRNSYLRNYNSCFNKNLKRLRKRLKECVTEYTTTTVIENGKKVTRKYPKTYNTEGRLIKESISSMYNARHLVMKGEMEKISSMVLTYCQKHGVTVLVISKNLMNAKPEGSIQGSKKSNQEFYQIPFGIFLNLLEQKAPRFAMELKIIDEAYTSKTSALTGDVAQVQVLAEAQRKAYALEEKLAKEQAVKDGVKHVAKKCKVVIPPNELNGVRGRKKKKKKDLGRGVFRDSVLGKIINSDLNGAANHIKVAFPELHFRVFSEMLFKFCNPRVIKSCHEFYKHVA